MADRGLAIVTGGNRGLGLETCRRLGELGYRVLLTARDRGQGERAAASLGRVGRTIEVHPLDVTSRESIAALAEHAVRTLPPIQVLVNNAGVALDGFDGTVARRTIDTNFLGPVRLTDALRDRLARGANVVMVSSGLGSLSCLGEPLRARFGAAVPTREEILSLVEKFVADVNAGRHAAEGWPTSAYSVSKVALNSWTRILARELAAVPVHVNAVCPGWVRTDMGGRGAPRSVEEGAAGIVWAATLDADHARTGGIFRDGEPADW